MLICYTHTHTHTHTHIEKERERERERESHFPGAPVLKSPSTNVGDVRGAGLISGSGRSPRGGYSNLLQYSCLKKPMDRAWWATLHWVTKSWTC